MPVTTTPAINLLPDTRTRTPLRWGAAKERRKLKGINRRFLRPPKSAKAADGVIGTAMKSCIKKHPTHLDQRLLRPTKLNNAGDNDTGDKFIAGHKNKDAMEVGSCQG